MAVIRAPFLQCRAAPDVGKWWWLTSFGWLWFGTVWQRLSTITGVSLYRSPGSGVTVLVAVAMVALLVLCAAFMVRELRLVAALLITLSIVVLVTPSPHMHYGALVQSRPRSSVGGGALKSSLERAGHS